jgi:hypothetical protein
MVVCGRRRTGMNGSYGIDGDREATRVPVRDALILPLWARSMASNIAVANVSCKRLRLSRFHSSLFHTENNAKPSGMLDNQRARA